MFPLASQAQAMTRTKGKVGGGSDNVGGEIVGPRGQQQQWLTD